MKDRTIGEKLYVATTAQAAEMFHENSVAHGFWNDLDTIEDIIRQSGRDDVNALLERFQVLVIAEKLALMHSELSEALEAVRKDRTAPDPHCPDFTNLEIELADLEIRRGDLIAKLGLENGEAILAKHDFNVTRPYKHGKQS